MLTLIGELIKPSKSVDLIVADIRHGGVDQTSRLRTNCRYQFRFVALGGGLAVADGACSHEKSVVS